MNMHLNTARTTNHNDILMPTISSSIVTITCFPLMYIAPRTGQANAGREVCSHEVHPPRRALHDAVRRRFPRSVVGAGVPRCVGAYQSPRATVLLLYCRGVHQLGRRLQFPRVLGRQEKPEHHQQRSFPRTDVIVDGRWSWRWSFLGKKDQINNYLNWNVRLLWHQHIVVVVVVVVVVLTSPTLHH